MEKKQHVIVKQQCSSCTNGTKGTNSSNDAKIANSKGTKKANSIVQHYHDPKNS